MVAYLETEELKPGIWYDCISYDGERLNLMFFQLFVPMGETYFRDIFGFVWYWDDVRYVLEETNLKTKKNRDLPLFTDKVLITDRNQRSSATDHSRRQS